MADNTVPLPAYMRVSPACVWSGLSRAGLYRILAQGDVSARKAGSTTLIDVASLKNYLDRLPPAEFRAPPVNKAA